MTQALPVSLRWHLVRRLVVLQATLLALLVLFIVAALWGTGLLISLEPDDDTIDALREAIARDATGGPGGGNARHRQMARAISQRLVRDPGPGRTCGVAGQGAAGSMPSSRRRARWDRPGAARLEHGGRARAPRHGMKWIDTPAGNVQILTGQGGAVSWRRLGRCGLDAVPGSLSCPSWR